jgi:serine/threonine-protein kinase
MSGHERPRTNAGRRDDEPEEPTDQGPADEPTGRIYDEPNLPRREEKKEKSEPRVVAPDPNTGDIVGDYELLEKLGKGGAGSVFRAKKRSDGAIVALKVLSASKAKRARIVQRFFDEVRAASAVHHPGLIRVFDFIEIEEPRRLAYAMELVLGETLRDRLKRDTKLDLREAIHVGAEVAGALGALHDAGIIHRDLKPENIMLIHPKSAAMMPGVKLLDFGVVKFLPQDKSAGAKESDEKKGTFVGTPRYMAPEQAAGGVVDARADLFAVGVLLFEMITGHCPHEGDSLRDVVMAKLKGAPRIIVGKEQEILPQELTDIVDSCLKLKPALRPKDAREVVRALRNAEAVLFVVGPVKAHESGSFTRPASLLSIPPASSNSHVSLPPRASLVAAGSGGTNPAGSIPPRPPSPVQPISPAPMPPEPVPAVDERTASAGRKLALAAIAIAVLAVLVVLAVYFFNQPMLIVPLDSQNSGETPAGNTSTVTKPITSTKSG